MTGLSGALGREVAAWRREMEVIALDRGRPATAGVLQRLTGVELTGVYGIARAEDGLRFETPESSTYMPGAFAWVEALWRGAGSTMFTPDRPEPVQRNRALATGRFDEVHLIDRSQFGYSAVEFRRRLEAFEQHLPDWRRFGLATLHHLRILVCEGPTLVGYMVAMHERPMTEAHRTRFNLLVGPLRRRLRMEHRLRRQAGEHTLLEAALEAFPEATFLVSPEGRVLHANQVGRALHERGQRRLRTHLAAAARGQVAPGTRVTEIEAGGARSMRLVEVTTSATRRASAEVARLGFTRRERQVLQAALAGGSYRMIAGALRISERTVERHVGALLHKAGAATMAELVVTLSARG
ncbi:MAG: hypothetical protein KA297_06165 [Kofleriaceae bacterium]|nr:hypothetical protein [Kofleriaceae bacterium]MBP6628994.1 hypothetical protein [Kofleriaceae bacterium]